MNRRQVVDKNGLTHGRVGKMKALRNVKKKHQKTTKKKNRNLSVALILRIILGGKLDFYNGEQTLLMWETDYNYQSQRENNNNNNKIKADG